MFFKVSQKSTIFLGYFFERICCQELSKIAQSGHTGNKRYKTSHWLSSARREQITFDKCNKMLLFIQNLMKIWEFKPNKVEKGIQKVCERI